MKLPTIHYFNVLREERESFYIYFSAPNCGVCQVLYPKLKAMMDIEFPKLKAFEVNTSIQPEIAAQLQLFTNPSLLVFFEGKEFLRRSRAIGLSEVKEALDRTYRLVYE